MSSADSDCLKGTLLPSGEPAGSYQNLNGIKTYVSLASSNARSKSAIIFLSDIFGFYPNSLLVMDSFAAAGFSTYAPDFLNNDSVPLSILSDSSTTFDMVGWRLQHTPEKTRPAIDGVIQYLRDNGIEKIGVVGYCFGGKYAFDLAIENKVQVAMMAHPSGIDIATDLERAVKESQAGLIFNACEVDHTWTKEAQNLAATMFATYAPGFEQVYHPGCTHGFGLRGDISVPAIKLGKELAFEETVQFFSKYL